MDFSPVQILIVLLIVVVIFGARRLPELGRNLGSGAREFKKGITGEPEADATPPPPQVQQRSEQPTDAEQR
jgi:sec-independent protein translocase protein TatA